MFCEDTFSILPASRAHTSAQSKQKFTFLAKYIQLNISYQSNIAKWQWLLAPMFKCNFLKCCLTKSRLLTNLFYYENKQKKSSEKITCTNLPDRVFQTWFHVARLNDKCMWKTREQLWLSCSSAKEIRVSSDWSIQGQHQG